MEPQEPRVTAIPISRMFRVLAALLVLAGFFAIGRVMYDVVEGTRDVSELVWSPLILVWAWLFGTIAIHSRFPVMLERLIDGKLRA